MKPKTSAVLFFCLVLIIVSSIISFYYGHYLIDYKEVPAEIRVSNYAGLNADPDALHFGTITKDGFSIRHVNLATKEKARLVVKLEKGVDWISVNKNNFVINPGEKVQLNFTGTPPNNYTINQTYNTTVKFYFYRVWS